MIDAFDAYRDRFSMSTAELRGFQNDFNVNLHAGQDEDDAMLDGDTNDLAGLTILDEAEMLEEGWFVAPPGVRLDN